MDATARRTVLGIAAILAFAAVAFASGGFTFGLLTDDERAGASIRAASDFDESPSAGEVVSFRGCGAVWLHVPKDESFTLSVALSDAAGNTGRTVTLTDADAGTEAAGFWYASPRDRYQFDRGVYGGVDTEATKILSVEFDGESVENPNRCAKVETTPGERTDSGQTGRATTTAGNAANAGIDLSVDEDGRDDGGQDGSNPGETRTATTVATTAKVTETTATTATTTSTTTDNATTGDETTRGSTTTGES